MLKQRLLTAAILIPLFVFLVLKSSADVFCSVTAALVLFGAWEWAALMGLTHVTHRLYYVCFVLLAMWGSIYLSVLYVLPITFCWWLIASTLVVIYPRARSVWAKGLFWRAIMGLLVLIPTWFAINFIRVSDDGPYNLLFLFVLIWGADSGAYFVGKKWGKNKLAPNVSPGKTRQGLYGAFLVTVILAVAVLFLSDLPLRVWPLAVLLSLITVLFSILGDLFESMLKRNVGLKDSGSLFPGHGGLLDRIDSLTAAAPIFALGCLLMSKIFL